MDVSNEDKTEETKHDSELAPDDLEAVSAGVVYMRYTMTNVSLHSLNWSGSSSKQN